MSEDVADRVRVAGTLVAALWLIVLGLLVAGYVAGAPPEQADSPEIDHSEPPNEVAADALQQLQYRDHTSEHWVFIHNRTANTTRGGIVFRVHFQHSERRLRFAVWEDSLDTERSAVSPDSEPNYVLFGNDFYKWQQNSNPDYWTRNPSGFTYNKASQSSIWGANTVFRNASATVVANNESVLAVRVTDSEALSRVDDQFGRYGRNSSMTVVVAKGENPHLTRVTLRNRTAAIEETIHVRNVGTATAPRPEPLTRVTATETIARIDHGLDELFG